MLDRTGRAPSLLVSRPRSVRGLRQPRGQDPHELRRRLRAHLRPRIRQVVLHGHVAPEAAVGGTIALVNEGDSVTIDADQRLLQLNVNDVELARRRAAWQPPAPRYTRGVLAKYAKLVSTASKGAVTD